MNANRIMAVIVVVSVVLVGCVLAWGAENTKAKQPGRTRMTITSSAFANQKTIPQQYTADGKDVSPPLQIAGVPEGAAQLALIVDDPDAPRPEPWVHWVICGIPASVKELPEGLPRDARVDQVGGAMQGKNTWGTVGYRGPEPPRGHGVHHYHFKVYALDKDVQASPGASKEALLAAMRGHILAEGELVGTYQR